jgi:predicted aspartyl protease
VVRKRRKNDVFMNFKVGDQEYSCLVDTGYELSMIPYKIVKTVPITPTDPKMYAVSGHEVPIMGEVVLQFTLWSLETFAKLLVSEAIEEMLLGMDWLDSHHCQ